MNLCKGETVTVFLCSAPRWQLEKECQYFEPDRAGYYCRYRAMARNAISGFNDLVICGNTLAHDNR